jgi:hypothetical protein
VIAPVFATVATWFLAQPECPTVRMPPAAVYDALVRAIDRSTTDPDRLRQIETYVKTSALTAEQAVRLVLMLSGIAQRQNARAITFPFIVDKEAYGQAAERHSLAPPGWYALQPDRIDVPGRRVLVGYVVATTGVLVPGTLCLALEPIAAAEFADLKAAIAAESLASRQVRALRRQLRDRLFSATQAREILHLVAYRDEQLEAGRLLRPRVLDPETWNALVCKADSDWFDCAIDP